MQRAVARDVAPEGFSPTLKFTAIAETQWLLAALPT
jgi:hypothetical protein